MQKHEPVCVRWQQLQCQPFQRIQPGIGIVRANAEDQVRLPDRLLRPGGEIVVRQEDDVVISPFQRIEGTRGFGTVEIRAGGQVLACRLRAQEQAALRAREHLHQVVDKRRGISPPPARISAIVRGRGSGGGATLTFAPPRGGRA